MLHPTFRDSEELRSKLAECAPEIEELSKLATELATHTDASLHLWAEQHIAPGRASLQIFPTELGGQAPEGIPLRIRLCEV